ncbi:hypothetical protein OCAE111667_26275 [Occultella aeris]|uniref:Uncharacterized protein n=1 Tax=Occultella aeris TaxID=2761496 RepID=A0A7M4DNJ7_9MICO|nr:hypothetical protein [Occultella aeris]VZO39027.1 hypothetical protein HALOF300_03727 [Occultella aeris]
MDASTILWIVVAVAGVFLIVAIVWGVTGRSRKERALEHQRARAADLRREGEAAALDAQRREAEVSRAAADAKQQDANAAVAEADAASAAAEAERARVDAENRRRESQAREADAQVARAEAEERLREADRADPDVPEGQEAPLQTVGRTPEAAEDPAVETGTARATPTDADATRPGVHHRPAVTDRSTAREEVEPSVGAARPVDEPDVERGTDRPPV